MDHPSTLAPRPSTAELLTSSKARWGPRRRQSPRSAESPGTRAASSSGMVVAIVMGWAARVRVEVGVSEESCARAVGASCGQEESLESLFT